MIRKRNDKVLTSLCRLQVEANKEREKEKEKKRTRANGESKTVSDEFPPAEDALETRAFLVLLVEFDLLEGVQVSTPQLVGPATLAFDEGHLLHPTTKHNKKKRKTERKTEKKSGEKKQKQEEISWQKGGKRRGDEGGKMEEKWDKGGTRSLTGSRGSRDEERIKRGERWAFIVKENERITIKIE